MKLKLTAEERQWLRDENIDEFSRFMLGLAAHDLDAMEAEIARLNEIKNRIQKSFLEEIGILIQETRDLKFTIARLEKENAALRIVYQASKHTIVDLEHEFSKRGVEINFSELLNALKEYEANHGA